MNIKFSIFYFVSFIRNLKDIIFKQIYYEKEIIEKEERNTIWHMIYAFTHQ